MHLLSRSLFYHLYNLRHLPQRLPSYIQPLTRFSFPFRNELSLSYSLILLFSSFRLLDSPLPFSRTSPPRLPLRHPYYLLGRKHEYYVIMQSRGACNETVRAAAYTARRARVPACTLRAIHL